MSRWRMARTWARRLLGASVAGGVIGTGLLRAQEPTVLPLPSADITLPALIPDDDAQGGGPAGAQPPASGAAASPPAAAPAPGGGTASGGAAGSGGQAGQKPADDQPKPFDWTKVPTVTPMPRLGWFTIPPAGPGYYSLWDELTGNCRPQPPKFPFGTGSLYPTSAFDYDFRYLDDPNNTQHDWSDFYKRVHFGECNDWLFSTGGEVRYRYADELNSRGTGATNVFHLFRTRAHADLWYRDEYRAFVEFHYAETVDQDLPPLAIDATGPDLLNAFVEAKVGAPLGGPLYVRAGRQELLYGSQRLISTLDWANARRTFQGVKAYWRTEQFNADVFWVQPVVPNRSRFDSVDTNRNFFGVWTTYKPRAGAFFDLYYLGLTTANAPNNGDVQTLGGRYAGDVKQRWLYDFEGAVQFGERGGRHLYAQMATGGLGYRFADLPWNPHFWAYYDYASGDKDPTGPGSNRTFNQLFAFSHYYFGYLDLVARQNIRDLNFQFSVNPRPWVTALVQFHRFWLDARRDALYDARGTPFRRDATGAAGDDVGAELDLFTNFHLSAHQDLLLGWSKLFAGEFWRRTGPPSDPQLFYAQYSFRW